MNAPTNEELTNILRAYDPLNKRIHTIEAPQVILLAHYTSVQVIEQILKNKEVWLSNPLYMNDLEEMRLGILLASQIFPKYAEKAGGNDANRTNLLVSYLNEYLAHLQENALDTYIFCLCTHEHGNSDGLLCGVNTEVREMEPH